MLCFYPCHGKNITFHLILKLNSGIISKNDTNVPLIVTSLLSGASNFVISQTLLQLFLMQNGIITDTDNVECELQLEDNEIEILRGLTGLDNSN